MRAPAARPPLAAAAGAALLLLLLGAAAAQPPASAAAAPAPSPGDGTNEACCAQLAAIGFQSNLPVVLVDTRGAGVTRDNVNASICTCSTGLQKGDLKAEIGFRIRGGTNSQRRNRVLQYAVDIDDKKWFLGIPKSRKWMLYAQQLDPFGVHNWLGYNLTRATGQYAARTQFCELFLVDDGQPLNTQQHYRGIYVGMEKPRQETNRVNISKNTDPDDVSGGYMMEHRHGQNEEGLPTVDGVVTTKQWNIEYPKEDELKPEQRAYIQGYLNDFERALYGPDSADPVRGWRRFANETAWVDWFLAIELVRNVKHSYHSAAFLTKDAGKPFVMGPVWNNVQGFGTCCGYPVKGYESDGDTPINPASGGNGISPTGWLFTQCLNDYCPILDSYAAGYGISTWFQQLWKDPSWVAACAARYRQLRAGPWANGAVNATITSLGPLLTPAALRTLQRWPAELRQAQWYPTPEAQVESRVATLASWTAQRLEWLDFAFQQAVQPGQAQGPWPAAYPGMTTGGGSGAADAVATAGK